jgi:hypothetical protein
MSNNYVTITCDNVDPDLLLQQYRQLIKVQATLPRVSAGYDALEGIINLLEAIFENQPNDFPVVWKP